jgi:GntR family transcriptional regulator
MIGEKLMPRGEALMSDSHSRSSTSDLYTSSQPGDGWAADAARQGKVGTQRLLEVETGMPTPDVRVALQLGPDEQVVWRRRLILADDQPVEVATSYYPARIAVGTALADPKKIKGGAVSVLAEQGYPLDESVDHVTAELPTMDDRNLLEVRADQPVIVIRRTSGPAGGAPTEYAENRMVADRIEPLEYQTRNSAA